MKRPCVIPIPGFANLAHEQNLTFGCFCSNLQPFARVIWAKSARELLVFGQNWGSAWQKILWLASNAMYDSHPRLYNPCVWTNFDFEIVLQQPTILHTWDLGHSSPHTVFFLTNLLPGLALNCVFGLKNPYTIPIPGHEPVLTLECFCGNLQPFAHVNWAKSALELLVFVKNGSQLGTKCRGWVKCHMQIPSQSFYVLPVEKWISECFSSSLESWAHVMLGQSSPQTVCCWPKLGVGLTVHGVFRWEGHVQFPSHAL